MPFPPTGENPKLVVLTQIGPLTFEAPNGHQKTDSGFERDLINSFTDSLGIKPEFITTSADSVIHELRQHNAHLAAAWLSPDAKGEFIASSPLYETSNVLVQGHPSEAIKDLISLSGRTVHAVSGSHAAYEVKQLILAGSKMQLQESKNIDALKLLEQLSNQEIDLAVVDRATYKIALNYFPNLEIKLTLGKPHPITWLFPAETNPLLIENLISNERQLSGSNA